MTELFGKDVPLAPDRRKGHKKQDWENFVLVGRIKRETLKAVYIDYALAQETGIFLDQVWLPLSEIKIKPPSPDTQDRFYCDDLDLKEFHMPLWLAKSKGLL